MVRLPSLPRLMLTRADFPEQDWAAWRRQEVDESPDDDGATIDTSYLNVRPCCIHCATWICTSCHESRRSRASRAVSQYCPRCGGRKGFFIAIRHLKPHEALPKVPFLVPVMSTTGAQGDVKPLIQYYKDLAVQQPGRDQLWENQVTNQPAENEYEDPGFSLDALRPDGSVSDHMQTRKEAVEKGSCAYHCLQDGLNYIECEVHGAKTSQFSEVAPRADRRSNIVQAMIQKVEEALANGCQPGDRLTLTIAEAQALIDSKFTEYPHDDGEVLSLGPGIFVNPDAGVLCWKGENWVRQPESQDSTKAVAGALADPAWQKREALEFAIRAAAPASSTQRPIDRTAQIVDTADAILVWLQK